MKLALIFLSVFVTSHGLFHQQSKKNHWRTPSLRPFHVFSNYHPVYYNYLRKLGVLPSHQFRPIDHAAQNAELMPSFIAVEILDDFSAKEFSDDQPKIKRLNRYRPDHEPRFFFKNVASLYSNVFVKTVTFTSTSSVTLTNVQTCIEATNIFDAQKTTYCRRKRDILENLADGEEDFQFDFIPSELEQVMPTMLPSLDLKFDHIRQVNPSEILFQDGATSFNEPNRISSSGYVPALLSLRKNLRGNLLFKPSLTSTTVTSFSFASTTVTKTVAIAGEAQIKCLPLGWVVCY